MTHRAFPIHDLAQIFPLIEGDAFDEFVEDVKANGLRHPIVLYDGAVLDGRNRLRACERLGIDPATTTFDGDDPLAFVVSTNLRRRHLRDSQRALIAARLANMPRGGRREFAACFGKINQQSAARLLNVKVRTVGWAKLADKNAAPEIISLVERGRLSASAAGKISRIPAQEQQRLANDGPAAVTAKARQLDRLRGRHGRAEYGILWNIVDEIAAALEGARLDKAHLSASQLVREIDRVAKSRHP